MSAAPSLETLQFYSDCLPAITWHPPMSLSEWSDENAYISTGAEPGRFHAYPYQRGILDAMTDPAVNQVSVMKSARVGYTRMIGILIAYHIAHDPCPMLMAQPTLEMAEDYSKNDFDAICRDFACLTGLVIDDSGRKKRDTVLLKRYPGGPIRFVGANSPAGFRKIDSRVVMFDEVDGYSDEAGKEGDQISLGKKRAETYWNRLIVAGSTPTDSRSRIAQLYDEGDCRKYHVPCPHCGHMHVLVFKNLKWPEGQPKKAYFECPSCSGKISHTKKVWMVERGKWIAEKTFNGHASFHIWTAYSFAANASWGDIATAFIEAKNAGPKVLKTFINTWLGEVWKDTIDAPDWNQLWARREPYPRAIVPAGARYVTAGVDVQKDRLEVEIKAWGAGLENWTIDYLVFEGDSANIDGPSWNALDALLATQFESETGISFPITRMGIDANYLTQQVCTWCRQHGLGTRVYPLKGDHNQPQIIRSPKHVDISTATGKRKKRGARLWFVGVSHIKKELYGWYGLPVPTESDPIPATGFCHFGDFLDEQYFKMITSEELTRQSVKGHVIERWDLPNGRRNEALDCSVYNRAMGYLCGVDRIPRENTQEAAAPATRRRQPARTAETWSEPEPLSRRKRKRSSYW